MQESLNHRLVLVTGKSLINTNAEGVHFIDCEFVEQTLGAYNLFERCTFHSDVVLDFCRFESCNFMPSGTRKQTLKHSTIRNCKFKDIPIPDETITKKHLVLPDGSNVLNALFVRPIGPVPHLS